MRIDEQMGVKRRLLKFLEQTCNTIQKPDYLSHQKFGNFVFEILN